PGPIARCAFFLSQKLFDAIKIQRSWRHIVSVSVMSDSLAAAQRENNARRLLSSSTIGNSWREATRHLAQARLQLFRRGQSYAFPGFETAGHGADVFVAHFLQALGGERGAAASAAMANHHCVQVRNFFFDVELDRAAA